VDVHAATSYVVPLQCVQAEKLEKKEKIKICW